MQKECLLCLELLGTARALPCKQGKDKNPDYSCNHLRREGYPNLNTCRPRFRRGNGFVFSGQDPEHGVARRVLGQDCVSVGKEDHQRGVDITFFDFLEQGARGAEVISS